MNGDILYLLQCRNTVCFNSIYTVKNPGGSMTKRHKCWTQAQKRETGMKNSAEKMRINGCQFPCGIGNQ